MIPNDLATRLRALLDLPLPQVGSVTPTRAVSPELSPGQRFTAQISQPLPDGTFKALVAGRTLTLSLPQSVKNGDVLELVVTHTTPQAVFARVLENTAQETPKPTLSVSARLISQLLTGRESAAAPAALNEGSPLLPGPPQNGAQLAPLLQRAVAQSGMFYEAHQAQWVEGKLPISQLLAEPQAKLLNSGAPPSQATSLVMPQAEERLASRNLATIALTDAVDQLAPSQDPRSDTATATTAVPAAPSQLLRGDTTTASTTEQATPSQLQRGDAATAKTPEQPTTVANANTAQSNEKGLVSQLVPRELAPLVLNQLDSLATQQLTWQGQIWPGQTMQWTIDQPPDDAHGRGAPGEETEWRSTLRVTLPSLGGVEACLFLTPAGVAIRFAAQDASSVARLNDALPALGDALDAVGVPLTGAAVAHEAPH
ncbi:hypothetical protein GCM10025771_28840 [Niveibacterium umoris]|uniref:Flagellar hook-length control protein-like C-terminal domain-containing protein n=1 Tax=Niveibacterium umoris TaxID=1193620 RepID=A0A840BGY5_9RHOO|nr:flagellar hook-length control protein FliK [Niveibacterium umoris]MBB4011923.1 hypothetical protein [Niveibacterium umoris]